MMSLPKIIRLSRSTKAGCFPVFVRPLDRLSLEPRVSAQQHGHDIARGLRLSEVKSLRQWAPGIVRALCRLDIRAMVLRVDTEVGGGIHLGALSTEMGRSNGLTMSMQNLRSRAGIPMDGDAHE